MGVFCKKNGKVGVIEYSEISKRISKKEKRKRIALCRCTFVMEYI